MKVLVLTALYPPYNVGGAEKSVSLIARGLVRLGHDVNVLTVHEGKSERRDVLDGVRVIYVPLRNFYWPSAAASEQPMAMRLLFHAADTLNVAMAAAVKRVVREERPDIVLSNNLVLFSALAWQPIHAAGIPILHTFRDFYLLCPKSLMYGHDKPCARQCLECRPFAWPRRILSHKVDGITGVSQFMIDRHRNLGLFKHALVLPSILSAVDMPEDGPRETIFRTGQPVRFGYIGRVAAEKGLDRLLDGLQAADPKRWTLKIAGRGSTAYLAHLRQRCENLPVEFLGFTPSAEFYRSVDVAAVPSVWEEPLPRTLLEAFAYGLPVLGSNRGGIPEVLESGRNGYLVDLDKEGDMQAAVARILDAPDEARGFGNAGRLLVQARTYDTVAAEYEVGMFKVAAWKKHLAAVSASRHQVPEPIA